MEIIDDLKIHIPEIQKAALIYRAVNHKLRQAMLQLIHKSEKITVTELYKKMHLEQSVASQHLGLLRRAGFVVTHRDRHFIYYSVNYKTLKDFQEQSRKLLS